MFFSFTCSYDLEYYASRGATDDYLLKASWKSKIVHKVSDPSKSSSRCNVKTRPDNLLLNISEHV